jgi:hypothetical protein
MEQSSCLDVGTSSASPEILRILVLPKVQYRVHRLLYLSLSWGELTQSVFPLPPHPISKFHYNIIPSSTPGASRWSLQVFHENSVCIYVVPIRATCPACVTPLNSITRIMFGE